MILKASHRKNEVNKEVRELLRPHAERCLLMMDIEPTNIGRVAHEFVEATDALNAAAKLENRGPIWINEHPIAIGFGEVISRMTGGPNSENVLKLVRSFCLEIAKP